MSLKVRIHVAIGPAVQSLFTANIAGKMSIICQHSLAIINKLGIVQKLHVSTKEKILVVVKLVTNKNGRPTVSIAYLTS